MHMCSVDSVMFDPFQPHGLYPARLLCPWDFLNKNTRVGCHAFFQGTFLTQGLNLLHCRQILYLLNRQRSPGMKITRTQISSIYVREGGMEGGKEYGVKEK